MRTIDRSTQFKRDFFNQYHDINATLVFILHKLVKDQRLPPKFHDHPLIGDWAGYRECHLKPDFVLLYKKIGDHSLHLARLGAHSDLF